MHSTSSCAPAVVVCVVVAVDVGVVVVGVVVGDVVGVVNSQFWNPPLIQSSVISFMVTAIDSHVSSVAFNPPPTH